MIICYNFISATIKLARSDNMSGRAAKINNMVKERVALPASARGLRVSGLKVRSLPLEGWGLRRREIQ